MGEETGTVVSGSRGAGGSVDYANIEITSEAPTEYHYTERRAELLSIVRSRGHPRAVSQSHLADRYGVSQQQISKDLDRLADYIEENLGSRRLLETHAVLARAVSDLLEEDDWRATQAAGKLQLSYDEWLREETDLAELRERIDRLEGDRDSNQ